MRLGLYGSTSLQDGNVAENLASIGTKQPTPPPTGRRRSGRAEVEPDLSLATWHDAERLFRARREAIVPVAEPMVLISQIQRSGGR
jgi:hypothetical protein